MNIGKKLRNNYEELLQRIRQAESDYGREAGSVSVIAVSKTFPWETLQAAIDNDITVLGENRIQEAKEKFPRLTGNFTAHMIGHLQSNKAKEAVKYFDVIHSLDSESAIDKVGREAEKIEKVQKVLIQVNTVGEEQKSGCFPEELPKLVEAILKNPHMVCIGLMNIAPFTDDESLIRKSFSDARELMEKTNNRFDIHLSELSMGMSGDFPLAIAEGATMVRVGSFIFGNRTYTI